MPKPKLLQLSGAKKRQIAKQKAASERSVIASVPRLDRYLIHSLTKEDNGNNGYDNNVKVEKEVSTSAKSKYVESDSTETSDAQTQSSDSDSDQSLPSDDDEQRNESKDF